MVEDNIDDPNRKENFLQQKIGPKLRREFNKVSLLRSGGSTGPGTITYDADKAGRRLEQQHGSLDVPSYMRRRGKGKQGKGSPSEETQT